MQAETIFFPSEQFSSVILTIVFVTSEDIYISKIALSFELSQYYC